MSATGRAPFSPYLDTDKFAANFPGAGAEGDPANENQGSLSAPEKDTGAM